MNYGNMPFWGSSLASVHQVRADGARIRRRLRRAGRSRAREAGELQAQIDQLRGEMDGRLPVAALVELMRPPVLDEVEGDEA